MSGKSDQEVLAQIRTLMALERNYLAEERTALAEFRTGLALIILGSPTSAAISFILSTMVGIDRIISDSISITSVIIIIIIGSYISFQSRNLLKKIRKRKKILKIRELDICEKSETVYKLLADFLKSNV